MTYRIFRAGEICVGRDRRSKRLSLTSARGDMHRFGLRLSFVSRFVISSLRERQFVENGQHTYSS